VCDGKSYRLALSQSDKLNKVTPQTFGYVLRLYPCHPEAKSLAPDGSPCLPKTRGQLQRASINGGHAQKPCKRHEVPCLEQALEQDLAKGLGKSPLPLRFPDQANHLGNIRRSVLRRSLLGRHPAFPPRLSEKAI
jgi:hypothetical protein